MSTVEDRELENTVEPAEKTVDLGLPRDQAMQRFFLKRVQYGREFKFTYLNGDIRLGFVTAFDEFYFQISTSNEKDPKAVLIPQHALADIEETGKGLGDFTDFFQEKIRDYSKALRSQCAREINAQKRSRKTRD